MPTGAPSTVRRQESMGALVNLNNTPYYVHFDFFRMSVANLVVIGLMLVVFAAVALPDLLEFSRDRADLLFEGVAAGLRIKAANTDDSAIGGPQTLEDLDGTRFPRAIGAEQAEDLTFVDRKTDAAKGVDGAVAFRQVMDIDDCDGHSKSLSIAHSGAQANSVLARSERERTILMRRECREAVRKARLSPPVSESPGIGMSPSTFRCFRAVPTR